MGIIVMKLKHVVWVTVGCLIWIGLSFAFVQADRENKPVWKGRCTPVGIITDRGGFHVRLACGDRELLYDDLQSAMLITSGSPVLPLDCAVSKKGEVSCSKVKP